jgi:hypothetical protein
VTGYQLTGPPARRRRGLRALVVLPVVLVLILLTARTIATRCPFGASKALGVPGCSIPGDLGSSGCEWRCVLSRRL